MTIEINLTQIIFLAIAFFSGVWAIFRAYAAHYDKSQDARFKGLAELIEKYQEATHQLELEFLRFQTEIPRIYVRRDDHLNEVKALQETIQRELMPLRKSIGRIEDFLITPK